MGAHFGRWNWKGVFVMLLQRFTWLGLMVVLMLSRIALAQSKEPAMTAHTSYCTVKVDGLSIFYREAGPKDAPTTTLAPRRHDNEGSVHQQVGQGPRPRGA